MNSATHLMSEDRPEFERILDEALRADDTKAALAETGSSLNAEQVRTLALGAAAAITACAATEYQQYLKVREQVRSAASSPARRASARRDSPGTGPGPAAGAGTGPGTSTGLGLGSVDGTHAEGEAPEVPEVAEATGAGLMAVVTVLTPILAGIAALIFLLVGYSLALITPEPSMASPLRSAGWFFAVLAAAGAVLGMVGLLLTALRNPAADAAHVRAERSPAVMEARAAWRRAVLERGIRPYIHQALAESAAQAAGDVASHHGTGEASPSRHPRLGYSRPGFSSPNPGDPDAPRRSPEFSSPMYTSPDFSSPDFSSRDVDTGSEDGIDHPDTERAP